ncbi:uncharacterized protein CLAFUR5_05180 [Fulvia fulva]|uniref:Uncharacterized protein n=1 Tax=Passalora fulva TaxID=5499 RepID=A0A9Q8P7L5_PASFU|nr:uncharacterized protein CLAFUR5_05180 [Fulvia fulva]KAK4616704.1 hypothetical protein CLAFUR0_10674 [Fulvia fulva]UJO16244.1 hypothetical protein CLAFUR5_05180 [Fulvia fulva]
MWFKIVRYSLNRNSGAVPSGKIDQIKNRLLKPWQDSPVLLEEAEKQFWRVNEIHLHIQLRYGIAHYTGGAQPYIAHGVSLRVRRLHLLFDVYDDGTLIDPVDAIVQVLRVVAQDFTQLDSPSLSTSTSTTSESASMRKDLGVIIFAILAIPTSETVLIRTDLFSHPKRYCSSPSFVPLGLVLATLREDQIESAKANEMLTWDDSMIRDAYLQMDVGKALRVRG